jgi:hypothetical protein
MGLKGEGLEKERLERERLEREGFKEVIIYLAHIRKRD